MANEKRSEDGPRPPKIPYETPRIQSETIFETQSLVTCGKVSSDPGCVTDGFLDS
ncbi:MAG: hypothetical protein HYT87_06880 [Nitrospirae bacterium]|nr:hypothetical protein [Nitrospirota bacterium]